MPCRRGERGGPVGGAGADGEHPLAGVALHRADEPFGDPAGADDAPPQGRGGHGVGRARKRQSGREGRHGSAFRVWSEVLQHCGSLIKAAHEHRKSRSRAALISGAGGGGAVR